MPTPEELEKLNDIYRFNYDQMIRDGLIDPDEAYKTIFAEQQSEVNAQQNLTQQAEMERNVKSGRTDLLPQEIIDVLDLDSPASTYKPFSQFMPGFEPEVPEDRPPLPPAAFSMRNRNVYDPKRIEKLEQQAMETAIGYYQGQGFPSYQEAQNKSLKDFVEKFGGRAEFVETDPLGLGGDTTSRAKRYDLMFSIAKDPPMGFTQSAEQKAYEDLKGDKADPAVMGNIKRPDQPRRYAQYDDMQKVGPRAPSDAVPSIPIPFTGETIDVPVYDENFQQTGETERKTFDQRSIPIPGRTLLQGASPLAEDLRTQPELAREMDTSTLAVEAFRPQVVKSGEQVRKERAQQNLKRDVLLKAQQQIMDEQQLTEEDAFNEVVDSLLGQARNQARAQLENRVTPKMLLDYHTGSLTAMGRLKMFPTQEEIFDDMIETIAVNAVLTEYRNAGMYGYATKYDKLKGGRTYGSRTMSVLEDAWKYATTDSGNTMIQQMKKTGRIDPDAIVESTPVQYARNLNFVFRLALNPVVDIASETVMPEFRTGDDEVEFARKYGSRLVSPTVDFTDDVDGTITQPINLMDAYLKEVLVETATGRTLGNDIVSLIPEVYFRGGQSDFTEEQIASGDLPWRYSPDAFVIGGTIGEIAIPLEAPLKLAQLGVQGASKLPANFRMYGMLNKELNAIEGLSEAGKQSTSVKDAFELTGPKLLGGEGLGIIKETSKVSSHVADDAADVMLAMERVGDGILDEALVVQGLSARGQNVGKALLNTSEPQVQATKMIDDLAANPDKSPALGTAAQDSVNRRGGIGADPKGPTKSTRAGKRQGQLAKIADDTNDKETLDVVAETTAHASMKGKVAATLEGQFGLGDYHLLTDRVAVSSRFLNAKEKVPARYGTDGIARVPSGTPGMTKRMKGKPGDTVMVKNDQGDMVPLMVDRPMPIRLIEDVEEVFGPLKGESMGPRVMNKDSFVGAPYNPDVLGLGTTVAADGKNIPVNFGRLFQVDRVQDPFLDNIIRKVRAGEKITYAEDVYVRQRALEKFAGIRGGRFQQKPTKTQDGTTLQDLDRGYGEIPRGETRNVIPVQEGTQFADRVNVPAERRYGMYDAMDAARRSVSPIDVRDGLKAADETLLSPLQSIDELGTPIDPMVRKVQQAQTEAVVSLQRQTPLTAKTLRKQGYDDRQVIDEMFHRAVNGDDYTMVIKEPKPITVAPDGTKIPITNTPIKSDVPRHVVDDFYERLLGPAFNLPETRLAYEAATSGLPAAALLDDAVILRVLGKMQNENPQALYTAAMKKNAMPTKPGRMMASDMRPDTVDISAAKISYAVDKTRGLRVQKVITETMPQGQINIGYYAKQIEATKEETAKAIDALAAEKMGLLKNSEGQLIKADITPKQRARLDRPAQQQANYFMGIRSEATKLKIEPKIVDEVIKESASLYIVPGTDLATIGANNKALQKIVLDPETSDIIAKNLTRLQRAPGNNLEYLNQVMKYNIALRKRLVSGQLGGLALPNVIYHAENFVTAPMIASVTAPEYVGTVMRQQARAIKNPFTGRSPSVAGDVLEETGALGKPKVPFTDKEIPAGIPATNKDIPKLGGVGTPQMGSAGLNRYVTRQIGDTKYIGPYTMEEAVDLYRTKNLGSTQASLHLDDNFIRDVQRMAEKYGIAKEMVPIGTVRPGMGTSLGMEFADSTDRMFREAVFFKALSEGKTGNQASVLARDVLLDYGAMPKPAQETVGKAFLYMSFSWMMGQEMIKGMADPRKFRSVVAQLNTHRKTTEDIFGSQYELGDQLLYNEIDPLSEKDQTAFNVYYRNPVIGSFKQIASMAEGGRNTMLLSRELKDFAQTPQVMEAGLGGILEMGYNPYLALLKDTTMEYKKGVPAKTVYQISAIPPWMGKSAMEYFDIDYVATENRRAGKAEVGVQRYIVDPDTFERRKLTAEELAKGIDFDDSGVGMVDSGRVDDEGNPILVPSEVDVEPRGGYQLQFKSAEGYDRFLMYQTMLQFGGYQRLMNDLTGAAIAGGYLPEGTSFGYEESERGIVKPVLYLVGREKTIRVPKEWEKLDRQVRQQEAELRKFMEGYK